MSENASGERRPVDRRDDVLVRAGATGNVLGVLERVVEIAVRDVPGAELAGVTVIDGEGVRSPALSDALVGDVDAVQYATGQGPCLDAAVDAPIVRCDDLTTEVRWPLFASRAAELGVVSMLSVQMFTGVGTVAALNLYAKTPAALGAEAENVAVPLALHAAAALAATRRVADLQVALLRRDVIGQAKGILMERFRIGPDEAFAMLLHASQNSNRKLADLADDLTRTGELPASPRPPAPRRTAGQHRKNKDS